MGNVWEWTADYYSEFYYRDAAAVDPAGPATGPGRVFRGGAFSGMVELLRPWLMLYPDGTTFTNIRKIGVRCAK
ncbi:MAG: SUMF1/EgtB/PvdO family nonheme iron enzyme [Myxococcaceae bacterium]